jgi:glycosyltransferase involved in cell wall biosynthesis
MKISVAMPTMGTIPTQMAVFLYALLKTSKHDITIVHTNRADIAHARNTLIKDFLSSDCDYLLFLDDDNPPESVDAIDKLIEARKPIISGLIPTRTPKED